MADRNNRWALVLAAGDGRRLHSLTRTASGTIVPKQFCSLDGGKSLLEETVLRAEAVVPRERVCAVVAAGHRGHWSRQLASLPQANVIAQPHNRGTAIGILLPLLHIMQRDPRARILLLPSDHHVCNEARLSASLRAALWPEGPAAAAEVVLLGIEPRQADPELGYIVPDRNERAGPRAVERFVEKPSAAEAAELIRQGALWNTFIIVADACALLGLFERRYPNIIARMRSLIGSCAREASPSDGLAELYEELPDLDFSRSILQGQERYLRVVAVPDCGWSDLGTPARVAAALSDLPCPQRRADRRGTLVNLAAQHELLHSEIRA